MPEKSFNTIPENQISLKDIIDFLGESWKTILLGGVAGGLLGLGYGFMTPSTYEATANIQMGKVIGKDVEELATLLTKLKTPTYYTEKTYAACNLFEKLESGEVIAKKINPILVKNAPIITISYRDASSEDAKKCLEGVLENIRAKQALLAKPIIESKTNQLLNLKLNLESAESIVKFLPKQSSEFDFSDSKFSVYVLLHAVTLSKQNEIKDLRIQINDLEISLLEPQTKEAFLTTPIYAPQQKVSPKRVMILVSGLMAGLFIGLLLVMSKRAYSAYKASN